MFRKVGIGVLVGVFLFGLMWNGVLAQTTADVTVTATPAFVSISCNVSNYSFGTINEGSTTNTSTLAFGITNASTVVTNISIGVTTANWTGGVGWGHADNGTPDVNMASMYSNNNTWGTSDVIVKYASPNNIYASCGAGTNFTFGLSLKAPTAFTDGVQKQIVVRLTATP